jgi:hypothetical protein
MSVLSRAASSCAISISPRSELAPYDEDLTPKTTRCMKEVFVVMWHVESNETPEPMSTSGFSTGTPVQVYDTLDSAQTEALAYTKARQERLLVSEEDTHAGEYKHTNGDVLGKGYELVIRSNDGSQGPLSNGTRDGNVVGRELIWIMRKTLQMDR